MVRVTARTGRVELIGVAGAEVEVDGGTTTIGDDGGYDITSRTGTVRVTCPENAVVVVSTTTGAVRLRGHVADVRVITNTGKVEIERAIDVDVRTTTGAVAVGCCVHSCRVVTTSGKVVVDEADTVEVSTASARVRVGTAHTAQLHTLSGNVEVGGSAWSRLSAHTVSGNIDLQVPSGTAATMHLATRSGRVEREVPEGEGATVHAVSGSGNIRVGRR